MDYSNARLFVTILSLLLGSQFPSSWHSLRGLSVTSLATSSATTLFLPLVLLSFYRASPSVSTLQPSKFNQMTEYIHLVISALELMSKNIFCGAVRIVYAIIYTLFLVSLSFWNRHRVLQDDISGIQLNHRLGLLPSG